MQEKFKDETNIQAFIDDIAVQSKDIKILQEIFSQINKEIKDSNMEINELITNDINYKIINIFINEQLPNVLKAKYLGQSLNNLSEPTNIITKKEQLEIS